MDTVFLNVDVDVRSRDDLGPLMEALGSKVIRLHDGRRGRLYWKRFTLAGGPKSLVDAVRRLCRLLDGLPPGAKKLWSDASIREFDIGIQAGERPDSAEWVLDTSVLEDVAKAGARIRVTVYSPAGPDQPSS
jgi:hypothetical protein